MAQGLNEAVDVESVAEAVDRRAAVAKLAAYRPDVVVFDVELAESLDLLDDIRHFNAGNPGEGHAGVILIAKRKQRDAERTIKALEAGAFDFVLQPESQDMALVMQSLCRQLFVKMRNFSSKRIFSSMAEARQASGKTEEPQTTRLASMHDERSASASQGAKTSCPVRIKVILIGVSTGGPKTLGMIIPELCRGTDVPICVVQHMPSNFTASLAASLNAKCLQSVHEAKHGEPLQRGHVYIAPGGRHMHLTSKEGRPHILLTDEAPEDGCRPSVNKLFRSAAEHLRGGVVALVLTGMGSDGAKGVEALKRAGGYIIVQDKESSVVWGMPGSAVATGCVNEVLPTPKIPAAVLNVLRGGNNDG